MHFKTAIFVQCCKKGALCEVTRDAARCVGCLLSLFMLLGMCTYLHIRMYMHVRSTVHVQYVGRKVKPSVR